jgi:hypothetical protein
MRIRDQWKKLLLAPPLLVKKGRSKGGLPSCTTTGTHWLVDAGSMQETSRT